MRLLLDSCVWGGARTVLEAEGHDAVRVADLWPTDPGDDDILLRAYEEKRILVTLDKDFGELAVVHNRPHAGIIRLVNLSAHQQGTVCARVLARYSKELDAGAILTVTADRVRIRPSDS